MKAEGGLRLVVGDRVWKPGWVFRMVKDLRASDNVAEGETYMILNRLSYFWSLTIVPGLSTAMLFLIHHLPACV